MSKINHNTGDSKKNRLHRTYPGFKQIDGTHSFRSAVPYGYVDYPVRRRRGGKVFYFNFELAKEICHASR